MQDGLKAKDDTTCGTSVVEIGLDIVAENAHSLLSPRATGLVPKRYAFSILPEPKYPALQTAENLCGLGMCSVCA